MRLRKPCHHLWYEPHPITNSGGDTCPGGIRPSIADLIEELETRITIDLSDLRHELGLEATNETNQQSLDALNLEGAQPDTA